MNSHHSWRSDNNQHNSCLIFQDICSKPIYTIFIIVTTFTLVDKHPFFTFYLSLSGRWKYKYPMKTVTYHCGVTYFMFYPFYKTLHAIYFENLRRPKMPSYILYQRSCPKVLTLPSCQASESIKIHKTGRAKNRPSQNCFLLIVVTGPEIRITQNRPKTRKHINFKNALIRGNKKKI